MQGRERYTSRAHAGARFVAQRTLLRPVVWGITDVQVHGRENLDNFNGPYVVVSNHSSHLDTPLIIGALPRRLSRYLATGAAADYFFRNWWKAAPTALFFNAFPVERTGTRNRSGLAGKLLSDGVPLLLYPEGTRSRTGQMATFKPGAAALCISRNVPCIPIAIVGAHEAMPRDTGWVRRGRPAVHVVIGTPMWSRPGETARRFSTRISKVIGDMHDQTASTVGLPRLIDYASLAAEQQARESQRAEREDAGLPDDEERPAELTAEDATADAADSTLHPGSEAAGAEAHADVTSSGIGGSHPPGTGTGVAADAPQPAPSEHTGSTAPSAEQRPGPATRVLGAPVRAVGRLASAVRGRLPGGRGRRPAHQPATPDPAEPSTPPESTPPDPTQPDPTQPDPFEQDQARPRAGEEETS